MYCEGNVDLYKDMNDTDGVFVDAPYCASFSQSYLLIVTGNSSKEHLANDRSCDSQCVASLNQGRPLDYS